MDPLWKRTSILLAIVTFGISQILFELAGLMPAASPQTLLFCAWTVLWGLVVPLLVLSLLDRLMLRFGSASPGYRLWRGILLALLMLSLLRQFYVFHQDLYYRYLAVLNWPLIALIAALLGFIAGYGSRKTVPSFLSVLGTLALILPLVFGYRVLAGGDAQRPAQRAPHRLTLGTPAASRLPPVIVLVVFDELSSRVLMSKGGSIDTAAFPHFAQLSRESVWFPRASTNHCLTDQAMPSLITGRMTPSDSTPTLFELISSQYHSRLVLTGIVVENWLRGRQQGIEWSRGKADILSRNPLAAGQYLFLQLRVFFSPNPMASRVMYDDLAYHLTLPAEKEAFFRALESQTPACVLWHVSLPHSPFQFSVTGARRKPFFFPSRFQCSPAQFRLILGAYREQLRYTDSMLGEIVAELKRRGLYDSALIGVTSDHGLRMWTGSAGESLDYLAGVPLMIRAPGVAPAIVDSDFQQIDLVPTLLGMLHYAYHPPDFDGIDRMGTAVPRGVAGRKISCTPTGLEFAFNQTTGEWEQVSTGEGVPQQGASLFAVPVFQKGTALPKSVRFSAIHVGDDLRLSRQQHQDFLAYYLNRHFPKTVNQSDIDFLQATGRRFDQQQQRGTATASSTFGAGLNRFFLALSETYLLSEGQDRDVAEINRNWRSARDLLLKAGDLQPRLGAEINRLLGESDEDGDGSLNRRELENMIHRREPQL